MREGSCLLGVRARGTRAFNAHLLQLALHLNEDLAGWIYLWLKCAVLGHFSFHAFLKQFFVFFLQKFLLSVPE